MSTPRRIGVILAAGRGRRMGRTKQLIALRTADGETPLVAAAYDAIRSICDEMFVVLGHDADAVAAALGNRAFHPVHSNADVPMFESIRAGVAAACKLNPHATIVLQPGDHPDVAASTLETLCEVASGDSNRAVMPEFQGRGGHPVLIPSSVAALLIPANCPDGLSGFWSDHPQMCRRVSVDDAGVVRDIDLPRDLES